MEIEGEIEKARTNKEWEVIQGLEEAKASLDWPPDKSSFYLFLECLII